MNALKKIWIWISSFYMLKGSEKFAFGIPFKIHCAINHNKYCKKIEKYKNLHNGETCYIIGTGPSLTLKDLEMLKNKYTFGVNTLYKLFDDLGWQTTYYCLIDPKTYGNISDEIRKHEIKNIFYAGNRISDDVKNGIPFELECSDFYKIKQPELYNFTCFSNELDKYIYDGASVVYATLQIAVYMGFKRIVLLGVDCNYTLKKEELHNDKLSYTSDYNYKWNENTGLTMIEGFKYAKAYSDENGIEIINATRGGMLEVFERANLEDIVGVSECL